MNLADGFEHIIRESEPLAGYTWFRLGGPAEYFAEPTTVEELAALIKRFREQECSIRLLGGGSNLLVREEGVSGLVIRLSAPAFGDISVKGRRLTAGGGATLGHAVSTAVREGLAGLEHLVGIPGTVGGALHGNAGTQSGDIGHCTRAATVVTRTGEILERTAEDLHFAYRQSSLDELAILKAAFELEEDDPRSLTERMQKTWIVKRSHQPMGNPNCGTIFKDCGGMRPTDLIEQANLKGTRVGGAEVSDRDANFLVAGPEATSADLLRLIDLIKTQVAERLGVELQTQLEVW